MYEQIKAQLKKLALEEKLIGIKMEMVECMKKGSSYQYFLKLKAEAELIENKIITM